LETKKALTFVLLAIALATGACRGKNGQPAVQNEEAPARPVSFVKMNDVTASAQLLNGFYGVEAGAWRWTTGKFSVLLATPVGAAQNGGTLTFSLALPDGLTKKLGKITLTASVNGKALGSKSYEADGAADFTADVPKELLTGDSITVEFALDKHMAPGTAGGDKRDLGVIANSVGLASK
jgi:hypothetical protein